ncbi:DUF2259 domain-containing protein [Aquibium sp. A9E412]|uniref:DUF2259 domain-containing protein n=1 Tax=Aquibium sp. A9E412 TaxID=2976767 RepID=UPI0025AFB685|nr:DUF2259 domain-containing protein [Aquibium sp. A9E412]MDN2567869.1 DUF2259 domain-containing protein [Aquibium sp. A9E412]
MTAARPTGLAALLLFQLLLLLAAGGARAGDSATLAVLGFSADGGVFAFEEYGVQDGSGFPYANRYYIDTARDRFLPGTPIRVALRDEGASLEAARRQARDEGQAVIADAELARNRGHRAGWNAVTELSADPHRMRVNPRPVVPPIDAPLEFTLEELPMPQTGRCEPFGTTMGFRLLRIATEAGARTETVHEDGRVPQSRGCPLGYRLGGVQTFFPSGGAPVYAVLITIRQVGFEGPDHRWMAVTGTLPR